MRAILILFFLCIGVSQAFNQNLDSLKSQIDSSPDSVKFETILGYMRSLLNSDLQASYSVSEYALDFAKKSGDSLLITKSLYAQGFLLRRLEKENQAIEILKTAYGVSKRNGQYEELSKILNLLAVSYTYLANYDEALKCNFESLTVNERNNNLEGVGISLNNIGLVYFKLGNIQESLEYYEKSLHVKKKIGSKFDLERLHINMAFCFNQLKKYEAAEKSINEAFKICGSSCSDNIIMEAELCLGISLFERGKVIESKKHFETSLATARTLLDKRFEIENLSKLASVHLNEGYAEKALATLKDAEKIAKYSEYLQPLMDIYGKFASIYNSTNDYKNSSLYSKKYSDLRDSVLSEELIKNLADVQANYSERENLSTIADNEKVIRAQRNLNYAVAIIILFAFVFIYMIMRNSRMVRSLNSRLALEVQQKTIELVKSNHSLKQVNDELDNLVYKTSHDIRGPLATLKGVCNVALMDVKDELSLSFLRKLDFTSSQLNLVLDKFSRVNEIYNTIIRPQRVLIAETIGEILSLQQKITRQKTVQIIKEIEIIEDFETEPRLFYYALNSVIDNAFRYYNESQRVDSFVKIKVEKKRDEVVIQVTDNGVGVPINIDSDSLFHMFTRGSERSLTGGMGLFTASTAIRKLQGEIKFQRSANFVLTEFVLVFPVKMDYSMIEVPKVRGKSVEEAPELTQPTEGITVNT